MSLIDKLKNIKGLTIDIELKITFIDGEIMVGKYKGYSDEYENDSGVSQLDIETIDGTWYGLEEPEIYSIERV